MTIGKVNKFNEVNQTSIASSVEASRFPEFSNEHLLVLLHQGKPDAAIALARRAIQLDPPPSWATSFLSMFIPKPAPAFKPPVDPIQAKLEKLQRKYNDYSRAKKYDQMFTTLIEVGKVDPNFPWYLTKKELLIKNLTTKINAYHGAKQYKNVLYLVNKVLQIDPTHAWALELQGILDVTKLKAKAETFFSEKNYIEVSDILQLVESLDPSLQWPLELKTKIAQEQEERAKALAALDLQNDQRNLRSHKKESDHPAEGSKKVQEMVEKKKPLKAACERTMAEDFLIGGHYEEAYKIAQQHPKIQWAENMNRSLAPIMEMKIHSLIKRGHTEEAKNVIKQAVTITGNSSWNLMLKPAVQEPTRPQLNEVYEIDLFLNFDDSN